MNKTINTLQKEYEEGKEDVISNMNPHELEQHIMALANRYYVSYLNNDEYEYKTIIKTLDLITDEYKSNAYFNGINEDSIDNFINYCMLISINSILNDLMERTFNLRIPEGIAIHERDDDKSLAERNEMNKKYIRDFIYRNLKHTDNIKTLIRPDVNIEDVNDCMESLERIFLPEVVTALKDVISYE